MKRIVALFLAVLILLSFILPLISRAEEIGEQAETTEATETVETTESTETEETTEATEAVTEPVVSNTCGDGLTWSYNKGVLTVSGAGAMYDYEEGGAPWNQYREEITSVIFTGGVTYVGANAFRDYDSLVAIDFGNAMHTIGERAFQSCGELTVIHMPASFKRFSKSCFEGCVDLKEVYCDGGMPSFNMNCLWNYSSITVYCPADKPWNASVVKELEENFGGRLQVLTADGDDPYDFAPEETEKPTEAATAPSTEAATEPATEAATEPVTEATTQHATEATEVTEESGEETTIPSETVEELEEKEESFLAGKSWIAIVIIVGLLALMVTGTLIVRASSRGSKSSKKGGKKAGAKRGGKYVR